MKPHAPVNQVLVVALLIGSLVAVPASVVLAALLASRWLARNVTTGVVPVVGCLIVAALMIAAWVGSAGRNWARIAGINASRYAVSSSTTSCICRALRRRPRAARAIDWRKVRRHR